MGLQPIDPDDLRESEVGEPERRDGGSVGSGCPSTAQLLQLVDGEVDAEAPMQEHLGACAACQEKLDRLTTDDSWHEWERLYRSPGDVPNESPMPLGSPVSSDSPLSSDSIGATGMHELPSIAGYVVEGVIGRGGMGVVYRARQATLDRMVALKSFLPGVIASPEEFSRFETEAKTVAAIRHPDVVQVYDIADHEGVPFMAMELVDGCNLAELNRGDVWQPDQAARLIEALARCIDHVHQGGIVHRDIKPANILLRRLPADRQDSSANDAVEAGGLPRSRFDLTHPKLTDFGLAKHSLSNKQTKTGNLLGTLDYISPENARGDSNWSTPATDVYSLGVVLYEMLSGHLPFSADTAAAKVAKIANEQPTQLADRTLLPRDLKTICMKCLEKAPQDRYHSAAELAADLQRFREGLPLLARRVSWAGRAFRWSKRHPQIASLLGLTLVLSVVGMGTIWKQSLATRRAEKDKQAAQSLAMEMKADVDLAHYVRSIGTINHALGGNDFEGMRASLEACSVAHRSWEWEILRRISDNGAVDLCRLSGAIQSLAVADSAANFGASTSESSSDWQFACADDAGNLILGSVIDGDTRILLETSFHDAPSKLQFVGQQLVGCSKAGGFTISLPPTRLDEEAGNNITHWNQSVTVDFAASSDGTELYVCSGNGRVTRRRMSDGEVLAEIQLPTDGCIAVGRPSNRSTLGVLTKTQVVFDLDAETLQVVSKQVVGTPRSRGRTLMRAVMSRDGSDIAFIYDGDNRLDVYDLEGDFREGSRIGHAGNILDVAYRPDGKMLASSDEEGVVKFWYGEPELTNRTSWRLRDEQSAVRAMAWAGKSWLLIGSESGRVRLVSVPAQQTKSVEHAVSRRVELDHVGAVRSLAIGRTSATIATAGDDGRVVVRDARTLALAHELPTQPERVRGVGYCANDQLIVTACNDGMLRVFDAEGGTQCETHQPFAGNCTALACSPDGERVAVGGGDRDSLALYRVNPARAASKGAVRSSEEAAGADRLVHVHDFPYVFERTVRDIAFDWESTEVAAAGGPEVHVFDVATGRERLVLAGHEGRSVRCQFSRDGNWIVTAESLPAVRVWSRSTGKLHYVLRNRILFGVTPDSKRLVVVVSNQQLEAATLEFIDLASGFVVWRSAEPEPLFHGLFSHDDSAFFAIDQRRRLLRVER